jgi:ribose 5-phosphate isomerase A
VADPAEELKRAAAVRAARWIADGMAVGLGTGSTVRYLLEEIAAQRSRGVWGSIVGIPTSRATESRARELGIPLATLAERPELDLTIDGADEVDPELNLVKGLGGALLREKIVASVSRRLVIVVDASKCVDRLGTRAPLPVEVDPFGAAAQERFLAGLGGEPSLRRGPDGEAFVTDGGNLILDCRFADGIPDPAGLERRLDGRPGVLENGLFLGMASAVVVAAAGGIEVRSRGSEGE